MIDVHVMCHVWYCYINYNYIYLVAFEPLQTIHALPLEFVYHHRPVAYYNKYNECMQS